MKSLRFTNPIIYLHKCPSCEQEIIDVITNTETVFEETNLYCTKCGLILLKKKLYPENV